MSAGLYVHFPFCSAVCPYCDFAVAIGRPEKRSRHVETMLREIELSPAFPAAFDTVYFGGGTPSLLEEQELASLLSKILDRFGFAGEPHIFLEANPEDISRAALHRFQRAGVGTLSIGVQSFDDDELAFLGRRHRGSAARSAVEEAIDEGFSTVSLDLIFGLPGQSLTAWRRTLATAVALGPHHISCYELEVHERTAFGKAHARGELVKLSEDGRADLFLETHHFLEDAGYAGYEVSNFARSREHRSWHNRKYWNYEPYLGLGVSAHSFDGQLRFWNERSVARYEKKILTGESARAGEERLDLRQRALEELMLSLRRHEGLDLEGFARRYGADALQANEDLLSAWCECGLTRRDREAIRPTIRGLAVADTLAAQVDLGSIPAANPAHRV